MLVTLEDCVSSRRLGVMVRASKRNCGLPSDQVCEGLEVTCEDLPRVLGEACVILAQGEYGEDCVSSSLNTQPIQPDVQVPQLLELVYQIIVFTKPTGSISSTLSFPHSCVDEPNHYCLKTLTEDFL